MLFPVKKFDRMKSQRLAHFYWTLKILECIRMEWSPSILLLDSVQLLRQQQLHHSFPLLNCNFTKNETEFGDIFSTIGVREPQPEASLAFSKFGETHRLIEKKGIDMLRSIKVVMSDLNTFLNKAVPDTKLTIKKYADVKFEYLVSLPHTSLSLSLSCPGIRLLILYWVHRVNWN